MIHRLKRWLKRRLPKDSLTWRALTTVSSIVFYPRTLYRRYSKNSIFFFESEMDMCSLFPRELLDEVIEMYSPRSVLDLGCGTGKSLDYFLARGIDVFGIEGSALAISKADHPERMRQANLNEVVDLGRRFDLVWSYEVAEHIHPDYVENLIETFSRHADRIVLSAARPGQGGQGHFNEQPSEYWIAKFAARGFELDADGTARLRATSDEFAGNMIALHRPPAA